MTSTPAATATALADALNSLDLAAVAESVVRVQRGFMTAVPGADDAFVDRYLTAVRDAIDADLAGRSA